MAIKREPTLLQDPIFYVMLVVFALLTTGLPALLGQSWLLPLSQTAALTAFVAVAARHNSVKHAIVVMAIFLAIQFALIFLLTLLADQRVETAISDGFRFRAAMAEWAYGGALLPTGWRSRPLGNLAGFVAMSVGAYLTGGLAGIWILVRTVNQTAFSAAGFLLLPGDPAGLLIGLAPWTMLKIAGGVMLVAVLAQALWTNTWSPGALLQRNRRTLLIGALLLILAVLAEFVLGGLWRSFFIDPY
jgi:hypothetical protein